MKSTQLNGLIIPIVNTMIENASDRPDVLQDIRIKIKVSLENYTEQGSFDCWVRRIAMNVCNDYHRKKNLSMKHYTSYRRYCTSMESESSESILLQREIYDDACDALRAKKDLTLEDKILVYFLIHKLSASETSRNLHVSRKIITRVRNNEKKRLRSIFKRIFDSLFLFF